MAQHVAHGILCADQLHPAFLPARQSFIMGYSIIFLHRVANYLCDIAEFYNGFVGISLTKEGKSGYDKGERRVRTVVDGNIILSVAKAMELLQTLSQAGKPLSLKELAQQCGYPKSTVFGLLTTMRTYDVITQTAEGKYTLGLRLFEYGRQVERSWDISLVAHPYMERLCQQTGASVMLSICEGDSVITLDQVEARDKLRIVSDVGARLPIYCTSQGKVFLAYKPPKEVEKLLRRQSMTPFTPHTIIDPAELIQEIRRCRTNGYAIEDGEYKIGLRSISAPVHTVEGEVRYTVGVIGMFRSTHSEEFHAAVEQVCATAGMISVALGYQKQEE